MSGAAPPRMFCFHHAGAGVSSFARWQRVLGDTAEVVPVELPGRGSQVRQPCVTAPPLLLEQLVGRLGPLLDRPFVLYGHSLGGLVAHAFAQAVVAAGLRPPERLVLGAVLPPHLASPLLTRVSMPLSDTELVTRLAGYGLLPRDAVDERFDGIWHRTVLPVVRADLRLAEALHTRTSPPGRRTLPVPVLAVAGREDRVAPARQVAEWERYAPAGFERRILPGGHLFVRDRRLPELLRVELGRSRIALRSGSSTA